ncbi:MAG: 16S rRNA (guanine(527)-N(7))-methyltransferase RsmG [Eubacteriales bacterium]
MTDFVSKLLKTADKNEATKGIIDTPHAEILEKLATRLVEENSISNLTAVSDEDGIILKHFCDSASVVPFISDGASVCDVGCGGGFPSLVIAVLRGDVSVLAVDSVKKKVDCVKRMAENIGLKNIAVASLRAEEMGKDPSYREKFDVVTSRAVGKLNLISELCLPLVKVGGVFIAMKSLGAKEELENAKNAIELLGGRVKDEISYSLTDGKETISRTLIIIEKIRPTDKKYPRNNSQISKKPL